MFSQNFLIFPWFFKISFEEKVWMGEKSERKESVYSKYVNPFNHNNDLWMENMREILWIIAKLYEESTCKTIPPPK